MIPFVPDKLPLSNIDWSRLITLIGDANRELAKYDSSLKSIVNPNILLSPLTTNEAVLSSKIEGTQATLQDVLKFEASPDAINPKYHDIQEVLNYRIAINSAIEDMKIRPINLNLIKSIHYNLLDSVRGTNKTPGQFRRIQNWIGAIGTPIEQAFFVPPDPAMLMTFLSDFENYIHYEEKDRIVQLAIIHAQFEILHPFLDGNGRLGRILIPLFLFEKKLLSSPAFYMSEYFEANRRDYYETLRNITNNNQWQEWIEFFLTAFISQARKISDKSTKILDLYNHMKHIIRGLNIRDSLPVLDTLFYMPIFTSRHFISYSGIPKATALKILKKMEDKDLIILLEKSSGRKPNVYIFTHLLSIIEER